MWCNSLFFCCERLTTSDLHPGPGGSRTAASCPIGNTTTAQTPLMWRNSLKRCWKQRLSLRNPPPHGIAILMSRNIRIIWSSKEGISDELLVRRGDGRQPLKHRFPYTCCCIRVRLHCHVRSLTRFWITCNTFFFSMCQGL